MSYVVIVQKSEYLVLLNITTTQFTHTYAFNISTISKLLKFAVLYLLELLFALSVLAFLRLK